MIEHIGRRSGAKRRTTLEVVDHDPASGAYVIASAWGSKSDWFRNIQHNPNVTVWVGGRRFPATAVRMDTEDAVDALRAYASKHPTAFRQLAKRMVQGPSDDLEQTCRNVAHAIPLVRLAPK